jgi:ParB-like chromosome segregation protein Spo0J
MKNGKGKGAGVEAPAGSQKPGAQQIEQIAVADLIPYARNARTHSEGQVAQIAGSIQEFGFTNPVLIDAANGIIAGHGRVMAAQKLGLQFVPCIRLGHLSDAQKRAYILADNRIALNSGWDDAMLEVELAELHADEYDLGLLGFDADELAKLMGYDDAATGGEGEPAAAGSGQYTNKITAPIYEPKGERPPIKDLSDKTKTNELCSEIEKAELPEDVRGFLLTAAQRHTVFNFRNIAEFYCHATAEVQHLMERSGLIIIDMDKAIQNGFVHLSERLGAIADIELSERENEDA